MIESKQKLHYRLVDFRTCEECKYYEFIDGYNYTCKFIVSKIRQQPQKLHNPEIYICDKFYKHENMHR